MSAANIFQDKTLEDLLAEHLDLKKKLGDQNFMVQLLWKEIRSRQNETAKV